MSGGTQLERARDLIRDLAGAVGDEHVLTDPGLLIACEASPARLVVFGHIGAGNLHVNVLGPDPADDAVDEAVMRLAAAHGGTISAEHGIGRAKAALLPLSRSAAEIAAMQAVKAALDPRGLFNPGVLL